jgi:O-antigen/teichoic acid export membrane protein
MHMSGNVTSKFFVGSSLGSMALPWLMGQLIAPFGPTAAMVAVMGSIMLAIGAYYLLNLAHRLAPTTQSKNPGIRKIEE